MTCPNCGHEGHDDQLRLCIAARQPGRSTELRRRTLAGMTAAIQLAIQKIAYEGDAEPKVFLYARPGNLPSVKVTVELHKPVGDVQVIMEETT